MATSYKIRLKRFNGVDYDILNLSSDNIIMSNGSTLQNIIPSTNGMVKNNNGNFQTATLGTDYAALSFTVNLLASGWSNGVQTINNVNFLATGFAFTVSPNSAAREKYMESLVYADDVTVDGQMVFHCGDTVPDTNLTINILRAVSA